MKLRTLFTILVLAMAACAPAPTATPSSTPTATHTATATFTPSATATFTPSATATLPTATPTPFALRKSGLESITIKSVCLNIKSAHFAGEIMEVIQAVLASVGVQTTSIGEECDAVLAVDVNFRALSATYTFMTTIDGRVTDTSTATCYNGATADGEIRLSHSSSFTQFNPFVADISARREPPDTLSSSLGSSDVCVTDPEDAKFDRVRYKVITDIFDGLVQLWGDQALLGALTHTATDDLARSMFKARSEELLPMLVERFLHGSSSDQFAAALALVAAGEVDEVDAVDLVSILAGGLEAANPMVREAALIALDDLDMTAKDALPALEHIAREDTDETLQNKAWSILGKLVPERFSEAAILVQELAEKETYYQASSRLVNMRERAFSALFWGLQDENPVIRSRVISILGEMGKPVIPELREALASEVTLVRAGAIGVVSAMSGTIPEDIAATIVDALEDESAEVRKSALRTIIVRSGEFSEEEERRALVQALYEDDFEKMEWAVHRFIMYDVLPPADTAAAIGRVLVESKNSKTRQEAAIILWKMGADTVDAVPALILGLDDESGNTRRYVAQTLIQLGPEAAPAIPKLIEKLEDPDTGVRIDAAKALGAIGPAAIEAVPALIARLDDPDAEVRNFSAESLTVLTGEDFGEDIEQWRRWWDEQE